MKPIKILRIAFNMVKSNKLRSWLTIIGVIIGIASVMAIVTTGEYFQNEVTETLEDLGGDTISIFASTPFNVVEFEEYESDEASTESDGESGGSIDRTYQEPKRAELTVKDVFTLRRIPGIEHINVKVNAGTDLEVGGKEIWVYVEGIDPGVWPEITTKKVGEGRMLRPDDLGRAVVVISEELAHEEALERDIRLNQMILLNGKSFRVVGILAKDGGLLGGLTGSFGASVFTPYDQVFEIEDAKLKESDNFYERDYDVYDYIDIKLYENADYDATLEEIEEQLRRSRKVDERTQDFYVSSSKEAIEGTKKLINGLTMFLAFIAGISLLVGSTGIANTMFTSVLEKTKEIGIMKAIGARNEDIRLIFLCNAAFIGLTGGIIGILLGTAVVQVILLLISAKMNVPFEFALSIKGTLIASLVSIIVGLIAGYIPAKNASELNPVDALRYE
ncbi:MAG: ABC transporter permease [Methanosarcinaceae archaeon]|nr:ABC transporter permease [Methanosarcinaceae archaeon]